MCGGRIFSRLFRTWKVGEVGEQLPPPARAWRVYPAEDSQWVSSIVCVIFIEYSFVIYRIYFARSNIYIQIVTINSTIGPYLLKSTKVGWPVPADSFSLVMGVS